MQRYPIHNVRKEEFIFIYPPRGQAGKSWNSRFAERVATLFSRFAVINIQVVFPQIILNIVL
jgi:hypothetical protein